MPVIIERRDDSKWVVIGEHKDRRNAMGALNDLAQLNLTKIDVSYVSKNVEADFSDGERYRIRSKPKPKVKGASKSALMASLGMVRVKGALGGTYFE